MYFTGIIIAAMTFFTIGIWHPIVIKTEYYWGTRPWVLYLLVGVCCCVAALFVANVYLSSFLGVFGASALWGIGELFSQKRRVEKGWFPMNPKRKHKYRALSMLVACLLSAASVSARPSQRIFSSFDASNGLADNSAQTIKCTKTGRMVVTTIGHVNFYDGDAFTHIDPTAQDLFPLPKYNGHYHPYFDKHHHLWLKDKYTVTCVDLNRERFIHNVDSVVRGLGMQKPVDDLFGDSNSHLWFLSGHNLHDVDRGQEVPVRENAELQDLDVWQDRLLLFFANGVVDVYDLKNRRYLFASKAFTDGDNARYGQSSVVLRDSSVFYQIRNGDKDAILLSFDVETRQWRQLMATPYHLNNMTIRRGILYVASEYGFWEYRLATGAMEHVDELTLLSGDRLLTDVNTLCFDRQGGMWVGTEKRGLLYAKPYASPFSVYSWDTPEGRRYTDMLVRHTDALADTLPRRVNCRFTDSRGWVWTGKYTGLELQKPGQPVHAYTKGDGLLNEMVHSIVEDDAHDVWVATSYGISHLFIRDGGVAHVETYVGYDNVPNETFVNGRAMKLDDGTIVMQSLDHIVTFNPYDFKSDSLGYIKLYPKLIRMLVNGRALMPGKEMDGRVVLDKAISRTWEVNVDYDQNTLSLTFSALNFFRPVQTYYRVRVKGVMNAWHTFSYTNSNGLVDRRGLLHLPLIGLSPGRYEVEVQASMTPDDWQVEPFVWIVNVNLPWWRSTGIYILLLAVLGVLALVGFYQFNRNTRLRMACNNEEADILRRVKNYVTRCANQRSEVLTPFTETLSRGDRLLTQTWVKGSVTVTHDNDQEFIEAMLIIVPFVMHQNGRPFTLRQLAALTGKEAGHLYELLATNLYKSPRLLITQLRMQDAAALLTETTLTVEEVADQCGFVSPNYFIASFYHHYRQTPKAYRNAMPR